MLFFTPQPQSNQRGIETLDQHALTKKIDNGLNRTSVGLKRHQGSVYGIRICCLNRTSVGLKPDNIIIIKVDERSLNRTSVGLKHFLSKYIERSRKCLNRTSVGLKRTQTILVVPGGKRASIEPAWD